MSIWVAATGLLFRDFEDGSVCFDPVTGKTCLLSSLAAFMLELCLSDANELTRDALLAQVLTADDSDIAPEVAASLVDAALAELQRAGLLAPHQEA